MDERVNFELQPDFGATKPTFRAPAGSRTKPYWRDGKWYYLDDVDEFELQAALPTVRYPANAALQDIDHYAVFGPAVTDMTMDSTVLNRRVTIRREGAANVNIVHASYEFRGQDPADVTKTVTSTDKTAIVDQAMALSTLVVGPTLVDVVAGDVSPTAAGAALPITRAEGMWTTGDQAGNAGFTFTEVVDRSKDLAGKISLSGDSKTFTFSAGKFDVDLSGIHPTSNGGTRSDLAIDGTKLEPSLYTEGYIDDTDPQSRIGGGGSHQRLFLDATGGNRTLRIARVGNFGNGNTFWTLKVREHLDTEYVAVEDVVPVAPVSRLVIGRTGNTTSWPNGGGAPIGDNAVDAVVGTRFSRAGNTIAVKAGGRVRLTGPTGGIFTSGAADNLHYWAVNGGSTRYSAAGAVNVDGHAIAVQQGSSTRTQQQAVLEFTPLTDANIWLYSASSANNFVLTPTEGLITCEELPAGTVVRPEDLDTTNVGITQVTTGPIPAGVGHAVTIPTSSEGKTLVDASSKIIIGGALAYDSHGIGADSFNSAVNVATGQVVFAQRTGAFANAETYRCIAMYV